MKVASGTIHSQTSLMGDILGDIRKKGVSQIRETP